MPALGKAIESARRVVRPTARRARQTGHWVRVRVSRARLHGGAGEIGMMRLLDLHAASCAGDTLVTMGLAGTIFFSVPADQARGRVAGYLLLTMAPFALLAPVVGPLLDRFRHGRRYALAVTMLGRAFLAWLVSDYINGLGLYPAAFGILVLSRAYGVARSAVLPRLLPRRLGLSEAGARAAVFGTVAGAVVAPLGAAAFWVGPQWALRVAAAIFVLGTVIAIRLPAQADSEPPASVPALIRWPWRGTAKVLSGRLVAATLAGGAGLRALYGFLALFLAFAIREQDLPTEVLGVELRPVTALGLVAAALVTGTFLATAVGTRLAISRPALVQAAGVVAAAATGVLAMIHLTLPTILVFCLFIAVASGLAKLAVDATIQARIGESVRASAFAASETLLMLAWVAGGAIGLVPFGGTAGITIAAVTTTMAAASAVLVALALRRERLDRPDRAAGKVAGDAGSPDHDQPAYFRYQPSSQTAGSEPG